MTYQSDPSHAERTARELELEADRILVANGFPTFREDRRKAVRHWALNNRLRNDFQFAEFLGADDIVHISKTTRRYKNDE